MTQKQANLVMGIMKVELERISEMQGFLKQESLGYNMGSKREIAHYYGVGIHMVNVEYNRYHAIWRCYKWDLTRGVYNFPSDERIDAQLSEPTLPDDQGGI